MMKHHFSTMLKEYPDHYGHDSTHPPHPIISQRNGLVFVTSMTCLQNSGTNENGEKNILDLRQS